MGATIPKQFLEIKGKAIILHTLEKFKEALPLAELLLVLPESEIPRWKLLASGTAFENIEIAIGGDVRFESVKAGLRLVKSEGIFFLNDDPVLEMNSSELLKFITLQVILVVSIAPFYSIFF